MEPGVSELETLEGCSLGRWTRWAQECPPASEAAGMCVGARVNVPSTGKTRQDAPSHLSLHAFPFAWFVEGGYLAVLCKPARDFIRTVRYWKCQPTLEFLPGKLHGQRSLVGYSPWGRKELDTTE